MIQGKKCKISSIGVIGAMDVEVDLLINELGDAACIQIADCRFYSGEIAGVDIIVVKCGVGKVNAARVTQMMIDNYAPAVIINTGVAGGLSQDIKVGDIVIGTGLVQHDFDITFFGHVRGHLSTGHDSGKPTIFDSDDKLVELFNEAASSVVNNDCIHLGIISSGDQFIADADIKKKILSEFYAVAAEMEGAAVAQTAYYSSVPFVVVRAVSDDAEGVHPASYPDFERETAIVSAKIILEMIKKIN